MDLKHGRYVVVDIDAWPALHSQTSHSASGSGRFYGVVAHTTAARATKFIETVPNVVVGRATTMDKARAIVRELLDQAHREFEANNRFLTVQVQSDGTITLHVPHQAEPKLTLPWNDQSQHGWHARHAVAVWLEQLGLSFDQHLPGFPQS